jgi:hypothetical protein
MSTRKHCKFLRMVTVRMSRDERRRVNEQAAAARLPLNTWVRRKIGLPDHAIEENPTPVTESDRCYLVLAGNIHQAKDWAQRRGLPVNPMRRNGWLYAANVDSIHGIRDVQVVRTGTFHERNDDESWLIRDAVRELVARGMMTWAEHDGPPVGIVGLPKGNGASVGWVKEKFEQSYASPEQAKE